MKRFLKYALLTCLIFGFAGCSDEKDNLTGAIEDAWETIEPDIEKSAEKVLKELADNPQEFFKGKCETDYMSLGDIFTLRIPIDYEGRAAFNIFFGDDASEFLSFVENASINSKSKSDVKKLIEKHFNSAWATMMVALIILDGEFDYDFETDDLLDTSFEFDANDLYNIINEKGYFEGGYGDNLSQFFYNLEEQNNNGAIYTEEDEENVAVEEIEIPIDSVENRTPDEEVMIDETMESNNERSVNNRLLDSVDESLLDLTNSRHVLGGGAKLELFRIDNKLSQLISVSGNSKRKIIKGKGAIGDNNVSLEGWLTNDGEIHGRYHNENGINLDFNGYITPSGSLYIQLGHDSEKSVWNLYPVSDEIKGTFRYEGFWGKNNKQSYVVFWEGSNL